MFSVKFDGVIKPCGEFPTAEKARHWAQLESDGVPYSIVRCAPD